MTTTVNQDQEIPTAYVRFARKVTPKQYETAEASVSLPVLIPNGIDDDALDRIHAALNAGKAEVLDNLGLKHEVKDGQVVEDVPAVVAKAFPGTKNFSANAVSNNTNPFASGDAGDPACPKCGGKMWDDRDSKRNPKAPDFKCRNKPKAKGAPGCEGVLWPENSNA